jgi:hypothetical protein
MTDCTPSDNNTCLRHGSVWDGDDCMTEKVLSAVAEARVSHDWDSGMEDGTSPSRLWALPISTAGATEIRNEFQSQRELAEEMRGEPTWMHLVRQEVAEAFQKSEPELLEEKLTEVAAVCVGWIEAIRTRPN